MSSLPKFVTQMLCSYLTVALSLACNMQRTPPTFFWNRTIIGGKVLLWWSCFIFQWPRDISWQTGFFVLRLRNQSEIICLFVTEFKDKLTKVSLSGNSLVWILNIDKTHSLQNPLLPFFCFLHSVFICQTALGVHSKECSKTTEGVHGKKILETE